MSKFKIANHIIELDWDSSYIYQNMFDFTYTESEKAELTFELEQTKILKEPSDNPLISSSYIKVYKTECGYLFFYPSIEEISSCAYDSKLQLAKIYLPKELDSKSTEPIISIDDGTKLSLIEIMFFLVRDVFLVYMQQSGLIAVHSSSIIYNSKAYLFSACSGTGKTTHTNMWIEQFGVQILDGDMTAICVENEEPIAYGLPWCGTSKQYKNLRVPLGGIVFLAQSCHNHLSKLTLFEAIIRLSARCFTPTWTKELADHNISIAELIIPKICCCYLGCLPNYEAVALVKDFIDKNN